MIRFSAQGDYLLLIPQGRALIRNRVLTRAQGACFYFEKQQNGKQSIDVYLKTGMKKIGNGPGCFLARTTSKAIVTKF